MSDATGKQDANFHLDTEVLGDIDAWNLRMMDDWYYFEANLAETDGPRGYRREVSGSEILADAPGPVLGFLSLGGARVARSLDGRGTFPHHVVAPADEVGAVGLAGLEAAHVCEKAARLTEQPQIAATAHAFLSLKRQKAQGLPLIVARAEHDESTSTTGLCSGTAYQNLVAAAQSVSKIAGWLGKRTSELIVSIEFVLEDVSGSAEKWATEMHALMRAFEREATTAGFRKVHFLSVMEHEDAARIPAQFELGLFSKDISFTWVAPAYAFARDTYFRTTANGMTQRAQIEALVIRELLSGGEWRSPTLLLAEWDRSLHAIRVTSDAARALHLDQSDPFHAGAHFGFSVVGAEVTSVALCPSDDRAVLVSVSQPPPPGSELRFAVSAPGALRESSADGAGPFRWALPARLKIGQLEPQRASSRKAEQSDDL